MNKKIRVYIASPYTNGWYADNIRRQIEAKHMLMDYGFIPFAPLESHFSEIYKHRSEKEWLEYDLEWLMACNILVRIRPNDNFGIEIPSPGADKEEETAKRKGLLIYNFNNLEELRNWAKGANKEEIIGHLMGKW